jgi:hypothetical protein
LLSFSSSSTGRRKRISAAIITAAAGSSPDYQQPALAYLDPGYLQADATGLPSVTVSLGGGLCQDFDLGALDLVGRRKVGVRAVDVSGNASAPSEVTVDFRR